MNTAKIAAAILGVGAASAGVTIFLSSQDTPVPAPAPAPSEAPVKQASTDSINVAAPSAPVENEEAERKDSWEPRDGERAETPAPEGIDQDAWNDAQRRMRFVYGFAQSLKDGDSRWHRRLEGRMERDTQAISNFLGLEGESSAQVQKLLEGRMNGSLENTSNVINAMVANEEGYVEYSALSEMAEDGKELTAAQKSRMDQLKNEIFGEFYTDGQEVSDNPFRDLVWRNPSSGDWYEDDSFLVKAAAEMPEDQGNALLEYAGKLDYLDRKEYAFERVNDIQRRVNLSTEQAQQLNNLYLENRNPSDEQISQIVPADQVQAVKDATSRSRWGRRGRR